MKRKENIVKLKADTFSDRVVKMYRHLREVRGEYIISLSKYYAAVRALVPISRKGNMPRALWIF